MTEQPPTRRLLVLSYHFTPDGSVGGLRWAGMSKYLARLGWEVHVVTAAAQNGPAPAGVTIHHVARATTLNDRYNTFAGRVRARRARKKPAAAGATVESAVSAADKGESSGRAPRPSLVQVVRFTLSYSLIFPDFGRGWILRAARTARALLSSEKYDLVVSSGPPHSAHVAAVLALSGRDEPYWVDMRDPWVSFLAQQLAGEGVAHDPSGLLLRLERLVTRRAQRVVTNTAQFRDTFRMFYPTVPVSFVSNGIDRDRLPAPAEKVCGFGIAYAGTLYYNRNLSPILRALPEMLDSVGEGREHVKLRIVGSMTPEHEVHFWNEVRELGLEDVIEARGRVSNAEAMDLVNRSHLALVLAQDQPVQIPAKIYECAAMGVPTLVIAESASAAAVEARRIGALTCEPTDIDCIRRILHRAWAGELCTSASAPIGYEVIARQIDSLMRGELGESSVADEASEASLSSSAATRAGL